jgi:hypothetical protein
MAAATACPVGDSRFHAYGWLPQRTSERTRSGACSPSAKPSRAPQEEPEEVRTLQVERVEHGDRVGNTRRQCVRAWLARFVASALTAVVGEDQPELAAQGLSQARRFRDFERIREAGVEENRRAGAS